jgi:hypothetical protein
MLRRALARFQDPHQMFVVEPNNDGGRLPSVERMMTTDAELPEPNQMMEGASIIRSGLRSTMMPFINKYTAVVDYRLHLPIQQAIARLFECVKAKYIWNTQSRISTQDNQQTGLKGIASSAAPRKLRDPMSGRIQAQVEIVPSCSGPKQLTNITIRTPQQFVHIEAFELPKRTCPFRLVRQNPIIRPVSSVAQFLSEIGIVQHRGECRVNGETDEVITFDGAVYPARLSECYTVLAKDCSSGGGKGETSRYAVLMKAMKNQRFVSFSVFEFDFRLDFPCLFYSIFRG